MPCKNAWLENVIMFAYENLPYYIEINFWDCIYKSRHNIYYTNNTIGFTEIKLISSKPPRSRFGEPHQSWAQASQEALIDEFDHQF